MGTRRTPTRDDPEAFAERMRAEFGSPDGPGHGGKRPGAGDKSKLSSLEAAESYGLVPTGRRLEELRELYPNVIEYLEAELDERRIQEIWHYLITEPTARLHPRRTTIRFQKLFGMGYDRTLELVKSALARNEMAHRDPTEIKAHLGEVAQRALGMALDLVRRDGITYDGVREVRETLKMVAGMHGLGQKLQVELSRAANAETKLPIGHPDRPAQLLGWLARMEAACAQVRADLEVERDAGALPAEGTSTDDEEPE